MCIKNLLFPEPKENPLPNVTRVPDPVVKETKPKIRKLVEKETVAKLQLGAKKQLPQGQQPVSADSLRINLGGTTPGASNQGGLNVG